MLPMIEMHRAEVANLFSLPGVRRLDVFGSAADGRFDSTRSDLDFCERALAVRETVYAA